MSALDAMLWRLGACESARDWAKGRTPESAWSECQRGDWMLWAAAKTGVDRRDVVRAACACARLALRHVKDGESRPLRAIETAEAWTRGEAGVTLERVKMDARAAAYVADAAYAAAAAAAAAAADDAAAYAAYAAYAAAAYADARSKTLAQCAELVRQHIPYEVIKAALSCSLPVE